MYLVIFCFGTLLLLLTLVSPVFFVVVNYFLLLRFDYVVLAGLKHSI